jgi:hypothetical protein
MPDEFRITGDDLLGTLEIWDGLMDFKLSLIACGGTALTLLGIKESTKDVDFIVPIQEQYGTTIEILETHRLSRKRKGKWLGTSSRFLILVSILAGKSSLQY